MPPLQDVLASGRVQDQVEAILSTFVACGARCANGAPSGAACPLGSPGEDQFKEWEKDVCLHGYSLAFHVLRPLLAAAARPPTGAPLTKGAKKKVDAAARARVLDLLRAQPPLALVLLLLHVGHRQVARRPLLLALALGTLLGEVAHAD